MMLMSAGSVHPAIAAEQEEVGVEASMVEVAIYSWLAYGVLVLAPWYPTVLFQPDTFAFHVQFSLPNLSRKS